VAEGEGEERTAGAAGAPRAVFISYASQDAAVASTVVKALERSGVACWIAPRDVTPGAFYADEIVHAIDAAKAIVLILSKNAADSQHVLREVEHAASKRHPVVSLRVDQAPLPAGLGYFLNTSQWLDASGGEIARSMPKLIAAVRVAIQAPVVTPEAAPKPRVPAPSPFARPAQRTAIIVVSLIGLAIVGFAVDRLWVSSRRAAPTSVPTAAVPAPAPAPAAPTIPEKSVAVLPFADMSEKKDQEYFSDGLSEELIDMLTKVPDLRVPARTSSFYFKGKQTTIADIAKALSVSHVLEGSVRKSGNKLRITAQLIRVDNGYHVWSETYDRQLDDIFKVQDEIAGAVVKALKASLLETAAPRSAPTSNIQAYTLYLQARKIWAGGTQADFGRASDYLKRALNVDPKFAQAWATLAQIRMDAYLYGEETARYREVRADVLESAAEALRLDQNLSDAHLAMARLLFELDWDWQASEIEVKRAIMLDPSNTLALRNASAQAVQMGRLKEALQYAQSAVALDPLQAENYSEAGYAQWVLGSLKESENYYRKALELDDTGPGNHYNVGLILLAQGQASAALEVMQQETFPPFRQQGLILVFDALGRSSDADRELASFEKTYALNWAYSIVEAYAARGDMERAFAWLDRAYRQHDVGLVAVKTDPLLKNLASDPRFKGFLRKMNLPE
jgi:TolB-like protein/Tfp pilus assembly protein PilF